GQQDGVTFLYEKSPLFADLLKHQAIQAAALNSALTTIENEVANDTLANKVARIRSKWVSTDPADAHAISLQNAAKALNGSKHLLNAFVNLGLSRSLASKEVFRALLYGPQRLPDADLVKSLYDAWTSGAADPHATVSANQSDRQTALSTLLDNTLNNILAVN